MGSASEDKTIKVWNTETQTLIATLEGHTGFVTSLSFNINGELLASAAWDGQIKLWNIETKSEIITLE